jgi:hypothetical protein
MRNDVRPEGCDLCGDVSAAMFLHARCHPAAPLMVRKEGTTLILTCYVPSCAREVARFTLAVPARAQGEDD